MARLRRIEHYDEVEGALRSNIFFGYGGEEELVQVQRRRQLLDSESDDETEEEIEDEMAEEEIDEEEETEDDDYLKDALEEQAAVGQYDEKQTHDFNKESN